MIMRGGKKSTAESIMYKALDRITEKAEGEAIIEGITLYRDGRIQVDDHDVTILDK